LGTFGIPEEAEGGEGSCDVCGGDGSGGRLIDKILNTNIVTCASVRDVLA
jgi:hypothetical protein